MNNFAVKNQMGKYIDGESEEGLRYWNIKENMENYIALKDYFMLTSY